MGNVGEVNALRVALHGNTYLSWYGRVAANLRSSTITRLKTKNLGGKAYTVKTTKPAMAFIGM